MDFITKESENQLETTPITSSNNVLLFFSNQTNAELLTKILADLNGFVSELTMTLSSIPMVEQVREQIDILCDRGILTKVSDVLTLHPDKEEALKEYLTSVYSNFQSPEPDQELIQEQTTETTTQTNESKDQSDDLKKQSQPTVTSEDWENYYLKEIYRLYGKQLEGLSCFYCASGLVGTGGYISDEELYEIYEDGLLAEPITSEPTPQPPIHWKKL